VDPREAVLEERGEGARLRLHGRARQLEIDSVLHHPSPGSPRVRPQDFAKLAPR
jgi:hypothetical protein